MDNTIILYRSNVEKLTLLKKRLASKNPNLSEINCYVKKDLIRMESCEFIFSPWEMPIFTAIEIENYFPNLKAIFYAGGTTKYFARPFLEKNIRVFSAIKINGLAVAEFTIAQILLANKGYFSLFNYGANIINYTYTNSYKKFRGRIKKHSGNFESVIGIVGLGNIGSKVAEFANHFNLQLIGYDPFIDDNKFNMLNIKKVGLEELFATADVVTCHLPNIPSTVNMIDVRLFNLMKPYSTFINTGRGDQVNEKDLCKVFKKRKDLTALLDVTKQEPTKWHSSLNYTKNIYLTPHIAGSNSHEMLRMVDYIYESYRQFLNGENPHGEVTLEIMETQT